MNVTPLNDPATAVVAGMDTGNVDTVLIGGRVMKRHGELLHVDWPAVRRMAAESQGLRIVRRASSSRASDEEAVARRIVPLDTGRSRTATPM